MKRFASLALVLTTVTLSALAIADDKEAATESGPWFDMEKCACCKHLGANTDMLAEVQWENHVIENGGMMVAVVPEQYRERWNAVCKQMQSVEADLAAGKQVHMCNFCQSFGKLMAAGAKMEEVKGGFGDVTLITSDKPEVVEMIHAHFKKTQEEYKKMLALQQQ